MSYISFESREGDVLIGGRERARMTLLVNDVAWALESRGHPFRQPADDERERVRYAGMRVDNLGERLGWVCLIGDDVTKLIAHIHGQCEIHGWVHPEDGDWFAGLVEQAVERGLLGEDDRNNYGSWADVAELARRSTSPLVTSYSVSRGWPEPDAIARGRPDLFNPIGALVESGDDALCEAWDALAADEQQRIADEAIASVAPRWHPAEWGTHWAALVEGRRPYAQVASRSGEQPPSPPPGNAGSGGGTIEEVDQ